MKKKLNYAFVLILLTLSFKGYSQESKQITISVQGIEYDSPNFIALKENLKKNPKVKSLKPSYTSGIAILLFTYSGEASGLWDELPKSNKQFYKLETINENLIALIYIKPQSTNAVSNKIQTTNSNSSSGCDYFPLNNYDETISYGGKKYFGFRQDDNSVTYYNCENGIVTKKWETTETVIKGDAFDGYYDDYVKKAHTLLILKSNSPTETSWKQIDAGFEYNFKLVEKGITLTYEGKEYVDVLKVKMVKLVTKEMKDKAAMLQGFVNIKEEAYFYYYAKKVGYIKSDDIYQALVTSGEIKPLSPTSSNTLSDLFTKGESEIKKDVQIKNETILGQENETKRLEASNKVHAAMKGFTNAKIAGLWKKQGVSGTGRNTYQYIRFNADGTVDFYESLLEDKFSGYLQYKYDYKIDGPSLYLTPNYVWTIKKYPGCSSALFELTTLSILITGDNL
jgi:hypothetical protein